MVEITERDLEIIRFIKNYKCVTSQMIADLYFSEANNNVILSNRRLNKIAQAKKLNKYRENILSPNIWYFGSYFTASSQSFLMSSLVALFERRV